MNGALNRLPLDFSLALLYLYLDYGQLFDPILGTFLFHMMWNSILIVLIPGFISLIEKFKNKSLPNTKESIKEDIV